MGGGGKGLGRSQIIRREDTWLSINHSILSGFKDCIDENCQQKTNKNSYTQETYRTFEHKFGEESLAQCVFSLLSLFKPENKLLSNSLSQKFS
jgi:hypothetical protein